MTWEALIQAAGEARKRAYAPYSEYPVGAALIDENGKLWTGCNVENLSFGLTVCAERVAIFKMVSSGVLKWRGLAVMTRDGGTPCGACLQVLAQFCDGEAIVVVADEAGASRQFTLGELLPHGFAGDVRPGRS